jgi:hypothetical protein
MKDILFKASRIKQELWISLWIFIFSFGLNIYSIRHYKTSWSELYTHLYIVILLSILFYCIILGVRLIVGALMSLTSKKKTKE